VRVARFSVHLMAQGAMRSPVYVDFEKGQVAVFPFLRGVLYIPVKAIQTVMKRLPLVCSIRRDNTYSLVFRALNIVAACSDDTMVSVYPNYTL
jgi:hypothetical protein